MAETPDTDHYGFTRIGEGETLSKNGFAALDVDRIVLDDLLNALEKHTHTGESRLADPVGAPLLVASATDGVLPPGITLYYRIAYLDRWGLETGASSESAVTTTGQVGSPVGIAATIETASGALVPGMYSYTSTFVTATGGETEPSPRTDIRITEGTTNRIRLDLPDPVPGIVAVRVYRARPGQSQFYFLIESANDIVYDDGLVEDPTITLPGFNTTNATNSVQVTVPGGVLPEGVYGWKLYRSVTPSTYSGFNLVHTVVEPTTDTSQDVRTTWIDTGGALMRGEPRQVSSTVSGGEPVSLTEITGKLPLSAMARGSRQWDPFVPGNVVIGKEYARFTTGIPIQPSSIAAFFLSAPVTSATGSQVGFRVVDSEGNFIEMATHLNEVTGNNDQYYLRTLPLTNSGDLEAENGNNTAPIVTDLTASNGQSVSIETVGQYSEVSLGVLERGRYQGYMTIRYGADTGNEGPPTDMAFSALAIATTPTTLAEAEHTIVRQGTGVTPTNPPDSYYELPALAFFAPGGQEVVLRATKATSEVALYLVDKFRYTAELTELAAGDISLIASVADLPDQEYTQSVPAGTTYWWFGDNYVILTPANPTATVQLSTSNQAVDTYSLSSSEPWLTMTPTTNAVATQSVTLTLDASFLSPGDRSVAVLTAAGTSHASTAINVIALIPPAVTGADVNVSVSY